jgi:hypothetical protein
MEWRQLYKDFICHDRDKLEIVADERSKEGLIEIEIWIGDNGRAG